MRKIFSALKLFIILLMGSAFFFCCSGQSFAQSSIKFKEIYYDFGEIEAIEMVVDDPEFKAVVVVHNFKFKNAGSGTLTITRVKSTCGCVAANLSGKNFQPEEEGEIEVGFEPEHTEGLQAKSIYVHSNDADFPIIKLTVRATIVGAAGAAEESAKAPPLNVLLVTFDTTRADHIGCYGYKKIKTPNIDRLAREGCLFEKAFTPVPITFPAHASMLTGLYPLAHGVRNNGWFGSHALSGSIVTLPELLKEQDYKTAAFVSAYVLDSRFGLDQGFDIYGDNNLSINDANFGHLQRRAEPVTQAAMKWLEGIGKEKFFLWVHYYDPHDPWAPPPPFSEEYADNPYDGEIAYADYWFGKLLDKIEELELRETTLIVFASDHGEGLGDHHERTHGIFLYEYALGVPLIFSHPRLLPESKGISSLVRLIDISPTILEVMGCNIPENMQGVSLLPLMKGEEKNLNLVLYCETIYPKCSHNWSPLEGLRTESWKYIFAPIKELYRMDKDPQEKRNLFEKRKDLSARMDKRLAGLKKEIMPDEPVSTEIAMDEQTREKLRSLGYVWAPTIEKESYPDPKEKIHVLEYLNKATTYIEQAQYEKAIPLLKKVLKLDPEDISAYVHLGQIYVVRNEPEKSIEAFEQAVKLKPGDLRIYIMLGEGYMEAGRHKEGLAVFKKALELEPECKEAYLNMGLHYFRNQKYSKAGDLFQKVLEVDPEEGTAHDYMSEIYWKLGDYDKIESEAEALLENNPDNNMALSSLMNLGIMYQITQQNKAAQDVLEKVIGIKPDIGRAHYYLGMVYFQEKRLPDALASLKKAIKYDPKIAEAHYSLGLIYKEQNDLQRAVKEYQATLDINPHYVKAKRRLQKLQPMIQGSEL